MQSHNIDRIMASGLKDWAIVGLDASPPEVIQNAAVNLSPALIANYVYDLVKNYNSFYQSVPILGAESEMERNFRIELSEMVGLVIASGFALLGIDVPERM